MDESITKKMKKETKKLLDYCQELLMLNYIYEEKLITITMMNDIKKDIEMSYKLNEN